jgi:hypothetical protein
MRPFGFQPPAASLQLPALCALGPSLRQPTNGYPQSPIPSLTPSLPSRRQRAS